MCQIILACAEPGSFNSRVSADLGVSVPTVMKWRSRFIPDVLDPELVVSRGVLAEYLKFLRAIDKAVPPELDIHIVCDSLSTHKTPAVNEWIARRPPSTSTSPNRLLLGQPGRWFAYLTTQLLQRGVHKPVQALEADVRNWIAQWNEAPRPFVW